MTAGTAGTATTGRSRLRAASLGLVAVLLGACAPPTTPPATAPDRPDPSVIRPVAPSQPLPADLQGQLRGALDTTMKEFAVPGAVAGVWVPGQGSWTVGAGSADVETELPVAAELQWPLRSLTKSYTVTLLLQLVDEGVVGLDDPISRYVSGVTDGDRITLRQLANMSSGNADYLNQKLLDDISADPERIFTLTELNQLMLGAPARFAPGTRRVYTNANTNLLGAVVEKATGRSFADVLDERILRPLGQRGTRYIVDVSTWTAPHPIGYRLEAGEPVPQLDNLSVYGPAGSMISTLDDARVWGEVLATGRLLSPATQAERLVGSPLEEGPPYDLYALGIGQTEGWWGHNGEGFGFTAALFHHPPTGATVAVFMNESDTSTKEHPADLLFRRIAHVLDNGGR